ncbi:MAG: hypothetical protein KGS48_02735 [Bacteroidetes bacterium]|nr:hypothetical protein [Bacteroidota bacterium]
MKHIFFSVLITLAFSYCANSPKSQTGNIQCYVRLDEQEGLIKAEASFRRGLADASIEIPGGMRFLNKPMTLTKISDIQYRTEFKTVFLPECSFSWNDPEKKEHTLSLPLNAISDFAFDADTLKFGAPAALHWKGPVLEKGESLVLIWEKSDGSATVPMEIISSGPEPKIEFPGAKMAELSKGKWQLYLVRKKLIRKEVDGYQTSTVLELYTKPKSISIR